MRARFGPELGPLALEQALLRRRAVAKHPRGDEMWWTREALEQATPYDVAVHRALRFTARTLDLCCSVGGDLLALPDGSWGVDRDEARLLLAGANAEALGRDVSLVCADVTTLQVTRGAVFVDPARRSGGRRTFDPRGYSPPLEWVLGLPADALGVKVAPGIPDDAVPRDVEVEVVSLRGEVKEAVLWRGDARRGSPRMATLLPAGVSLTYDPAASTPSVRPPGGWLLEPDGAVIRAHLVGQVAAHVEGWLLDSTIAYVSADEPVTTPYGRWYRVLEVLPFSVKQLRARLRTYDAGPLVVKKRGTAVEPAELSAMLRLTGPRTVTIVLTRAAGRQIAMIVEPQP